MAHGPRSLNIPIATSSMSIKTKLINNAVLHSFVLHEEPRDGTLGTTRLTQKVGKLMGDSIKTANEVATRHLVTGIVEKRLKTTHDRL